MTTRKIITKLKSLDACEKAMEWVYETEGELPELWEICEIPSWMFWLAGRTSIDRKSIVLAACECARTALKFIPEGETRPLKAIEAAEGYVNGTVTLDWLKRCHASAAAAYASARAAAHAAAYASARAAAYAASAVSSEDAIASAVSSADAAYAAYAAYRYPGAVEKKLCDIIRKHITSTEIEKGLNS